MYTYYIFFFDIQQTVKQSCNMKKTSVVNLDKLLEDFSHIEMKISELHGKNHLLNLELDKTNKLMTISQSREDMAKQDCATFQNVIKGLQQTIEDQYNLRDENEKLENTVQILKEKLKTHEKEHENMVDKLIREIKNKEKEHNHEQNKLQSNMNKQRKHNR
ncbi:coiled-coil domain-containing protein 152 [Ahaetulla prasina]|uniref:coiled-coil domain-containing protein 152 n=1 Tax=Ahaetulla prasina TaxID=499056 RepID=UPI0026497C9B|nr:coiled-coil domain-containing protein 152 [Ahaetulla prasina]